MASKISDYIFMFQKELGDKIIGNFKSSNYGRLSILTNFRLNVSNKFLVSPNCFQNQKSLLWLSILSLNFIKSIK